MIGGWYESVNYFRVFIMLSEMLYVCYINNGSRNSSWKVYL